MIRLAAPLATLALAACANTVAQAPNGAPIAVERTAITYSTRPCFGTCPVYSVTVGPDRQGVFEGRNHTAINGEKRFVVDAATYRRFADHLAGLKPESGDRRIDMQSPDCGVAPTDMPSIEVRWSAETGAADQTLSLYLGCRSEEAQRVAGVLRTAPDLLPVAAYIGKR